MKHLGLLLAGVVTALLSACNHSDYLNAIPEDSKALVAVDVAKMSGLSNPVLLKSVLHVSDLDKSGLDLSRKIYLFEDAVGNLGLCASVSDAGRLEKTLQASGRKIKSKRGFHFTTVNDSWIIGFSDQSMLVMGPVTIDAQAELQNRMALYLKQDEGSSVRGTPLFDRLDSISSPMAMVTQVEALPEKLVAPFTLGAPKNTDPSEVYIAAGISISKRHLWIDGETFSFNRKVNEALQQAAKVYRPIKGRYVRTMDQSAQIGIFMNVAGEQFLPLMKNNAGLQALLTGINAAIDMDNIIRSVDGDMAIVVPSFSNDRLQLSMAAQLANSKWLADVDYWKQSCPAGGRIGDWGQNRFFYQDSHTAFYFGVSEDGQFMSGSSKEAALASIAAGAGKGAADPSLHQMIAGQRMVLLANLKALAGEGSSGAMTQVSEMMRPFFGDVDYVVYRMK